MFKRGDIIALKDSKGRKWESRVAIVEYQLTYLIFVRFIDGWGGELSPDRFCHASAFDIAKMKKLEKLDFLG